MAKVVAPLTDTAIKALKPADKWRADGNGLLLVIKKDGTKWWRFDYTRPTGGRNSLSFGIYPVVSLLQARQLRFTAKEKISQGIDPGEDRKEAKQITVANTNSLDKVFNEWFYSKKVQDRASTTNKKDFDRFKNDLSPWLGNKHIKDIKKLDIIECLRRLDDRTGGESARKLKNLCSQIWRYAVTFDIAEHNIIADIDSSAVLQKAIKKNFAHITEPQDFAELLKAIDKYRGDFVTVCALKLAPLVIVRPFNIRSMKWSEIDFEKETCTIPPQKGEDGRKQREGNRMKMNSPHIVPLSPQAIKILKDIQPLTGHTPNVFFKATSAEKVLGGDTLSKALRSMGYQDKQTAHGFRHTADTLLNEAVNKDGSKKFDEAFVASVLAHTNGRDINKTESIYNKAKYLPQRKELMNWWSNYLDELKSKKF